MEKGCRDFVSGNAVQLMTFFNDHIDVHHVFPQAWCKEKGIPDKEYNSIVNKTPLSARTNRVIGGQAPSQYLAQIQEDNAISPAQLDEILESHLINPVHLRNDDFEAFIADRTEALSKLIETAMGRQVVRVSYEMEPEEEYSEPEDEYDVG
jgi:hypothetical protein